MTFKYNISRKLGFRRTHSLFTLLNRAAGMFLLVTLLTAGVTIQGAGPQGMNPQAVSAAIKSNAAALKTFNYQQRMQLSLKGEQKKVTLTQITHDMYGNEQKTQLSEDPPPDQSQQSSGGGRRGRLKEKIVAKKTGEFKEMMQGIAALITSYTEIPPDKLHAALGQAQFSPGQGDMDGSVQIQMQNVNQQGDSMTIWIDRTAMLFRRAVINTNYQGDPVTTTANYNMLPSGQVYMAEAIINYPKKEVVVQLDNSNYTR